ncbi:MAG: DUF4124 domain-containing protein [Gammaproteobacteria bacterium]|nr:DUF4124 domain-containing protein [Gammaproteobacteria bacterium]MBT4494953.1 DUF4124 domain-containing protein [Gammaproteobacteria bacterium]
MKLITSVLCLIALLATSPIVLASSVFKCTGIEGEVTFSFVPCAVEVPVQETTAEESEPAVPRLERLAQIDSDIATLEEQLDNTKRDYEVSLRTTSGSAVRNELSTRFDESAYDLIVQLNELQSERELLAIL